MVKFNYHTSAALIRGEKVSHEAGKAFASEAKHFHDELARVSSLLSDATNTIRRQEGEIEILKAALLAKEQGHDE